MEQLLIDSIIEKVDANETRLDSQGKELLEISKKVSTMTDRTDVIKNLADLVKKLQHNIIAISWPVKEMTELSNRLSQNNELLANPKKTKQIVFHTAGRLLWVIIGLFIGMVTLIIVMVNTFNRRDQYRMNDLMWRYVKLINHSQNLEYLQAVEKQYLANPEKMKSLVEMGELHLKQLEESNKIGIKDQSTNPGNLTDTTRNSTSKKAGTMKGTVN
jgi:hypothetical protein